MAGRSKFGSTLGLLMLPLIPAAFTAWLHPAAPKLIALWSNAGSEGVNRVDIETARREFSDALWLDARSAADFEAAHVPGALPLTEDNWETQLIAVMEAWDGRQAFLVYCGSEACHASESVARRLRGELGEVEVQVLKGGWDAWKATEVSR